MRLMSKHPSGSLSLSLHPSPAPTYPSFVRLNELQKLRVALIQLVGVPGGAAAAQGEETSIVLMTAFHDMQPETRALS